MPELGPDHRRIASGVVVAFALSAFAACGTEIAPPAQNIGEQGEKPRQSSMAPTR